MRYRRLGKTGVQVSALGLGAMRLPLVEGHVDYEKGVPIIRRALELGINYIDSAYTYCAGTSEVAVGKALKGWPREKVFVSTKAGIHDEEQRAHWRERLETQLRRLDADYIDQYKFHGLRWQEFVDYAAPRGGILEQARKAQSEGLFHHLALSCHDTPENMKKIIDTGEFTSMTLQYNLLDRKNEEVIAYAHEKGMGIVVMGPVGGGRLGVPSEIIQSFLPSGVKSTPEIALRFVFAHPGVTVALSGMSSIPMVEENVVTASREDTLSEAELRRVEEALDETKKLSDLYCTGCGYCVPCPNGVKIPDNFRLMNYLRIYGLHDYSRTQYANLVKQNASAESCLECGECEPKCPQNIQIIEQLKETAAVLGAAAGAGVGS